MTVSDQPEQPTTQPVDAEVDAAVSSEAPQAAPAETGVEAPVQGAAPADETVPADSTVATETSISASEGSDVSAEATSSASEGVTTDEPAAATEEPARAEDSAPAAPSPAPSPARVPTPAAMPKPPARPAPASPSAVPAPIAPPAGPPSNAATFGRVAEDGTVYVRTPDGEKAVGSYPGASSEEALAYFARKYDEMWAAAELLYHRVLQTGLSAKEATDDLAKLREHIGEANVVGDLPGLDAKVESIATAIEARRQVEATERAAARAQARTEREAIVAEAEQIAAQDPAKTQWKASGARIHELLDEWKKHQRSSVKLDRESENSLWQRFSAARNSFDKARRVYFAELESTQSEARAAKEKLVAEAEKLSASKEWGPTAGAFKRLMDQWRKAGRAGRKEDDELWGRFKAAQDAFFNAKDEVSAEEDKAFRANLEVKEGLLEQARALLPIKDLQATKSALRTIQDKWDAAGKVPRSDMGRIEGELRKVEQAVRDAEDARWKKSNPEVNHRASAFAEQIERALEKENKALDKARASGDDKKIKAAEESLASRRALLEMVHKAQS